MRIDPKYLKYLKHYILQSIYASISIFILTLILNDNPVLIASIGSTAFIVFAMPKVSHLSQKELLVDIYYCFCCSCRCHRFEEVSISTTIIGTTTRK